MDRQTSNVGWLIMIIMLIHVAINSDWLQQAQKFITKNSLKINKHLRAFNMRHMT